VVLGLALFGVGAMLYILVLSRLALNVAQSMLALQYVGVMLGSALILGEPISPTRLLGAGMIAAGVVVVAWSNIG
jgi:drug/metabolite transporter (DMT)-like permease